MNVLAYKEGCLALYLGLWFKNIKELLKRGKSGRSEKRKERGNRNSDVVLKLIKIKIKKKKSNPYQSIILFEYGIIHSFSIQIPLLIKGKQQSICAFNQMISQRGQSNRQRVSAMPEITFYPTVDNWTNCSGTAWLTRISNKSEQQIFAKALLSHSSYSHTSEMSPMDSASVKSMAKHLDWALLTRQCQRFWNI